MSVAIVEQYVNGETLLDLGYAVLVASQSTPGSWYECRDERCTCKGFEHRGKCRHADAVQAMARETVEGRG